MKVYNEDIDGRSIEMTTFDVPMLHEKWHEAESLGLVFVAYQHNGPDYWDDSMLFTKPADKDVVSQWLASEM